MNRMISALPSRVLVLSAFLLALAPVVNAQLVQRVEPELMPLPAASDPPVRKEQAFSWRPVGIVLEMPEAHSVKPQSRQDFGPRQIGYQRPVEALATPERLASESVWYPTAAGGRAFSFEITSPVAQALRLGLHVQAMPDMARLRFSASDGVVHEVSGAEVNALLQLNRDAGERGETAEIYWSPILFGETAIVEIELPDKVDPSSLRVSLPYVSHLFDSPLSEQAIGTEASGACNVDVRCHPDWDLISRATARMAFTQPNGSFVCTGTLLADADTGSSIPYFLSAEHCIGSQASASSLQTFWFYRSTACDSGEVGEVQSRAGGAALLYAASKTDTSFMRLNQAPPAGVAFVGWETDVPTLGMSLAGVHHPNGDLQKISFGALQAHFQCSPLTQNSFTCAGSDAASADHFSIAWDQGVTEPGSSGSGAYRDGGYLIGTLHGSNTSCAESGGQSFYGRFDVPYDDALHLWLSVVDGEDKTLEVARAGTGAGTVASSPAGIACGSDCSETFAYAADVSLTASPAPGSVFSGWSGACTGASECRLSMVVDRSVTATFTQVEQSALRNGTTVGGLAGSEGSERYFYFDVPNDSQDLRIELSGGSGDADLYVRYDATVSTSNYDCRSLSAGNTESCGLLEPPTGRYFILLKGFSAFSGAGLTASYEPRTLQAAALPSGSRVQQLGGISASNGTQLCAMVLINGEYMFSCDPTGQYVLDYPLDQNGRATMFVFVDGFAPVRKTLTPQSPTLAHDVVVGRAFDVAAPIVELASVEPVSETEAAISGRVTNAGGEPLCAMVLASGEYMFSCAGNGEFALTVPREADGSVTLFAFVDSMAPYRVVLNP